MKMRKSILLGLILVLVVASTITLCIRGPEVGPEKPKIVDISHSWGRVTATSTEVKSKAVVYNPNNFPIWFKRIDYTINMNDIPMGVGRSEERVELAPNANTTVYFETTLDNTKLSQWWVTHISNGEKTIAKVKGNVIFDLRVTEVQIPFEQQTEVKTHILEEMRRTL
jgi:LEA14-like dessication related protein